MSLKLALFWSFLLLPTFNFAQPKPNTEAQTAQTAQQYMEQGDYKNAAKYFKKAHKKSPKNDDYRYQLALAYYRQSKFADAIKYLQTIIQQPAEKLEYYRLLANAYDLQGDYQQSINILQKGLKQYPQEAELYFDWGVIEFLRKKTKEALNKWEEGIQQDPNHSDNYYWAAKTYASSNEPLWALLYGEIFMNIERNGGDRFNEMGKLVLNTYLRLINDSLPTPELLLKRLKTNPFEKGHYTVHSTLEKNNIEKATQLNHIQSVIEYRKRFLEIWSQSFNNSYPTPLYTYHQELVAEGHFEAYNYWMFNQANIRDYNLWIQTFEGKKSFQNFMSWYLTHPMRLHTQSYLVRGEYVK